MKRKAIDIACNLTDCVFFGIDRKGRRIHESDFDQMVARAIRAGVERVVLTGTTLAVSREAATLCRKFPGFAFFTAGIHPAHADDCLATAAREQLAALIPKKKTNKKSQTAPAGTSKAVAAAAAAASSETTTAPPTPAITLTPESLLDAQHIASVINELRQIITQNQDICVAIGETGLDYAELSPLVTPALQKIVAKEQLKLAAELKIPLLLHSRDSSDDFVELMHEFCGVAPDTPCPVPAVVHSFNGTNTELDALLKHNVEISVNASAFREEGLAQLISSRVPDNMVHIETDAPWVLPRPGDWGHDAAAPVLASVLPPFQPKESFVPGQHCFEKRNEPGSLPAVFAMLCKAKKMDFASPQADEFAAKIHANSMRVFFSR